MGCDAANVYQRSPVYVMSRSFALFRGRELSFSEVLLTYLMDTLKAREAVISELP